MMLKALFIILPISSNLVNSLPYEQVLPIVRPIARTAVVFRETYVSFGVVDRSLHAVENSYQKGNEVTDKSTTGYQNSIVYSSASPSNLWKQTSATTKSPSANYYNQQNQQTAPQDPYQNEYQTSSQNPAILPSQTSSNQNHEYPSTPNYGSPSNNANYDGNSKQQIENSENDNYDRDYQMPANVEKTPLIASKSGSQEFPENQNDRRSQKTTTARFTTVRYFPTSRPDIANRFPLVNKPDLNPILSPVDKLVINVEYPTMNYANLELTTRAPLSRPSTKRP